MQGYKLHQWHVYVLFWALLMTISLPSQAEVGPEAMLQEMTDQVLAEIRQGFGLVDGFDGQAPSGS